MSTLALSIAMFVLAIGFVCWINGEVVCLLEDQPLAKYTETEDVYDE